MGKNLIKRRNSGLKKMEIVVRVGSIPLVETSYKTAENVYFRIKTSNRIFLNIFELAETTMVETAKPILDLIEVPLQKIDDLMCKSLDLLEQKIPSIYLPPSMLYWNTKEYMADCLVKPVIKRANSVKTFNSVISNFDSAINVADMYIEKYLPENKNDDDDSTIISNIDNKNCVDEKDTNEIHAIHTIHKGQQVTRKLKRRLTLRTIAEAQALKKHSTEAINILEYAVKLIVTDPKLALKKGREFWGYLSKDEPENQTRPKTLEELIVMLTREAARRLIHMINFTTTFVTKLPKSFKNSTHELAIHFLYVTDSLIKFTHLEKAKTATVNEVEMVKGKLESTYDEIQTYTTNALERLAIFLSGRLEAEKITTNHRRRPTHGNNNPVQNNVNGVY